MLATWAQLRDPTVDIAKQRLAGLPISETGRGAEVPFPFADKSAYKSKHTNREINRAIRKAKIQELPIAGLHAIQHSVKAPQVMYYLDNPSYTPESRGIVPTDKPIVIQQDGKKYIHDGHHRLTAEFLMGRPTAAVRFVNFDRE